MRRRLERIAHVVMLGVALGVPAEDTAAQALRVLSTEHPIPGYFLAGSPIPDRFALGGFGESDNLPVEIDWEVPRRSLSLVALPEERAVFARRYQGFRVILANTTWRTVRFRASDSRLDIVLQALSPDGEWRDIEYLPQSWCGNSFHRVALPRGMAWTFVAPVYDGELETRLRFVLQGRKPLYSNEFTGRVNLGQFGEPAAYYPRGIMDPYE